MRPKSASRSAAAVAAKDAWPSETCVSIMLLPIDVREEKNIVPPINIVHTHKYNLLQVLASEMYICIVIKNVNRTRV